MKECCKSEINRVEIRGVSGRDDVSVFQCVACGKNHYRLRVEPGQLGTVFTVLHPEARTE